MTWPTDRPGYPMHAERDGWHWLKHPEDLRPFPSAWNAELRGWPSGALHSPQGIVDLGFAYLGPCLTPADLAAERAAAAEAMREACAQAAYEVGAGWFDQRTYAAQSIEQAIRALTIPASDALAAAVEAARRDGYEAACREIEALPPGWHMTQSRTDVAEAIRARAGGEDRS